MRRIALERAMDAALIVINLEVIQLALQVELVPKEYVVKILVPDRADQPSDNQPAPPTWRHLPPSGR